MGDDTFKVMLATLSLAGGVLGATLKAIFDRRADKKKPKTDNRADAYEDFIIQVISDPDHKKKAEFLAVRARLLVYGETNVLAALSKYYASDSSDLQCLVPLIVEIRKSLVTGHRSNAKLAISSLLEFEKGAAGT